MYLALSALAERLYASKENFLVQVDVSGKNPPTCIVHILAYNPP